MKSSVHGPKFLLSEQTSGILLVLDGDSALQAVISQGARVCSGK